MKANKPKKHNAKKDREIKISKTHRIHKNRFERSIKKYDTHPNSRIEIMFL